jgi:hypothetical protein
VLAAAGLAWAFMAPGAGAAGKPASSPSATTAAVKGDNGTVKIHQSTTPATDMRDESHVCVFYLDGFGFDAGQSVSWQIKSWPPTGNRTVVASGALTLASDGDGRTGDMSLPNGHYKLYWNFAGENGFAKQKVFWVACPAPATTPTATPTTPAPTATATPTAMATPTTTPTPATSSSTASGTSSSVPSAAAPTPVETNLPVTG